MCKAREERKRLEREAAGDAPADDTPGPETRLQRWRRVFKEFSGRLVDTARSDHTIINLIKPPSPQARAA